MTDDATTNKDLGTQGQEDTVKGKLNQAAGKVQSTVGKAIGNEKMQADGDAKQLGGKVQETVGTGERKIDNALKPKPEDTTTV